MKDTYFYETCSTTGEVSKYAKDLEFNGVVYGPRHNRTKEMCWMEASMIRTSENRRARAVLMDDGEWFVYAAYAKNNE
jgi:hypothetical protein